MITVDNQTNIHIWNADNGNLVLRITNSHPETQITAIRFDDMGRRVITGAADGSLKMWNVSNGQLLAVGSRIYQLR